MLRDLADRKPEEREALLVQAKHLETFAQSEDYRRNEAIAGLDHFLAGRPSHGPVGHRGRQGRGFLKVVASDLEYFGEDVAQATASMLASLGAFPLLLGTRPMPKLADVIEDATRAVRRELDNTGGPNERSRDARVARALLRAVGVDSDALRGLFR